MSGSQRNFCRLEFDEQEVEKLREDSFNRVFSLCKFLFESTCLVNIVYFSEYEKIQLKMRLGK